MKSLVKIVDVFFSGIEAYAWEDNYLNGDYYDGNAGWEATYQSPGSLEDFFSEPLSEEEVAIGYAVYVAKAEAKNYGYQCFYSDEVLELGRKLLTVK